MEKLYFELTVEQYEKLLAYVKDNHPRLLEKMDIRGNGGGQVIFLAGKNEAAQIQLQMIFTFLELEPEEYTAQFLKFWIKTNYRPDEVTDAF